MDAIKMHELTEKILVYLLDNRTIGGSYESPSALTPTVMAKRIGEPPSSIAVMLRSMVNRRLVKYEENYVVGYSTKKEVYSLTPMGIAKAAALVNLKSREKNKPF